MKHKADPNCSLSYKLDRYLFPHSVGVPWCGVYFWEVVKNSLSNILFCNIPLSLLVLIIDDISLLKLHKMQHKVLLAGLTAAKKVVSTRWTPPHSLSHCQWVLTFINVAYLELSTAQMHNGKEETIKLWKQPVCDPSGMSHMCVCRCLCHFAMQSYFFFVLDLVGLVCVLLTVFSFFFLVYCKINKYLITKKKKMCHFTLLYSISQK